MKFRWLLFFLLGLPAVAQPHGPPAMATSFVQYMSGPAACQVAAVYFDQTQHKPYYCYPANTWVAFGGSSSGVTQLIAGTNITLDPSGGTGAVTINATGGGSGPVQTCDASTMSNYVPGVCIGTLDTAQILAFDGTSGTAVNVITAPGAGKLVTISQASAQYVFNSQPFSAPCKVDVEVNSNQFAASEDLPPDCTQTTDQYSVQSGWGLGSSALASSLDNQPLGLYLHGPVNLGPIATSSLTSGAGGALYAANDTGTISTGNGDATYIVNTVDGGGAVLTYTITAPGTGYSVGTANATSTGGGQPGVGTGFEIDINSITQGDGSILYAIYFSVVPIT